MAPRRWTGLRLGWITGLAVLTVVLIVGASGSFLLWRHFHQGSPGQRMKIPGPTSGSPWLRPEYLGRRVRPEGPPFVTSVSSDHRYFLDQYGTPILVKGDAPWSLLTRLSPQQAQLWFADRRQQGFNAAIVSLIGATTNGAPSDDGATFDGLLPFVDGDVLQWQEPYWQRVTAYLRLAADHGITVMLYPIDGWTIGRSFTPRSLEQCGQYGTKIAQRFRNLPNIVWMSGGDYASAGDHTERGSDVDHCIAAMMSAIRETGDDRPFSMQFESQSFSTQNPYWAQRVDWNFVYTYHPTYRLVLDAYQTQPTMPAVLGEANYEGENNHPGTPDTTNETLRRQVLWALTSGAAGDFFGSHDWEFNDGWEDRLSTRAVTQITMLRTLFSTLTWWQLIPDVAKELVTGGRGAELTTDDAHAVLQNDFVTAARTPDGRLAVIYLPARQTISVNTSAMADGTHAVWIDPASGDRRTAPMSSSFTTPCPNADGDEDWLLILSA